MAAGTNGTGLATVSEDDIALYDRQIRLWGLNAQQRLANARVCLVGAQALGQEVAKNLVLAGIHMLQVVDDSVVSETCLGAQFMVTADNVGQKTVTAAEPKIKELNSRVAVVAVPEPIGSVADDQLAAFDVIVATLPLDLAELHRLNRICRDGGKKFYAAASHGLYGYVFCDLFKHRYSVEVKQRPDSSADKVVKWHDQEYVSLSDMLKQTLEKRLRPRELRRVSPVLPCLLGSLSFQSQHGRVPLAVDHDTFLPLVHEQCIRLGISPIPDDSIASYLSGGTAEVAPVASIIGGILAQDIINAIAAREQPITNVLVFNGDSGEAPIYNLT